MVTTNPMRMLAAAGIGFEAREYQYDESDLSGVHAAAELGLDPDCTFKTLVLRGDKNGLFVCCIPVGEEVDLKKAAVISGNKRAEMIHVKSAFGLDHGGLAESLFVPHGLESVVLPRSGRFIVCDLLADHRLANRQNHL